MASREPAYERQPVFVTHQDPVGRAEQNQIAQADLAPYGMADQVEQLWLLDQGNGTYALACIPFCVHGLALHDRVRLSDDGRWVTGLVEPSGHRALRMLWTPTTDHAQLTHRTARVKTEIATAGLLSEWRGRHVAIDLPPAIRPQPLLALMAQEVDAGQASWKWADTEPFAG